MTDLFTKGTALFLLALSACTVTATDDKTDDTTDDTDSATDTFPTGILERKFRPTSFTYSFQFAIDDDGELSDFTEGQSTYGSFIELEFEDARGDTCSFYFDIETNKTADGDDTGDTAGGKVETEGFLTFLEDNSLLGGIAATPGEYVGDGGYDGDGQPCELDDTLPYAANPLTVFSSDDDGNPSAIYSGVAASPGTDAQDAIDRAIQGGADVDANLLTGGLVELPFSLQDQDGNTFFTIECIYESLALSESMALVPDGQSFKSLTRAEMNDGGSLARGAYLGFSLTRIGL